MYSALVVHVFRHFKYVVVCVFAHRGACACCEHVYAFTLHLHIYAAPSVVRWKHLCEQLLRPVLLHLQLLRPFPDQLLQVAGVPLQHTQHGVDDVDLLPFVDVFELVQTYTDALSAGRRTQHGARCGKRLTF